jgi:flagellar hook-basal body complex protein FliE
MEIKGSSMLDQELRMLRGVEPIKTKSTEVVKGAQDGTPFMDFLVKQFDETNRLGLEADRRIEMAAVGEDQNPHDTVIAVQKADISFNLLLNVKDKLEQAYQTLVRTSIG